MKISIIFILSLTLLSSYASADSLCSVTCPVGMTYSDQSNHCVCADNIDYSNNNVIQLPATVFDFLEDGVFFGNAHPDNIYVDEMLGTDGNPVFLQNAQVLNTFYNSVPGVNMPTQVNLPIVKQNGAYRLTGVDYFPIDDQLLGNEGLQHNYLFTTKAVWNIDYNGGEYIYVRYDDGILIYVNNHLIVNQPNLHYNGSALVYLDEIAAAIGIAPGFTYPMHIFHSERLVWMSMLDITTDALIHPATCVNKCDNDKQCNNGVCDPIGRACKCQQGWSGNFCNTSVCKNVDCGQQKNNGRGNCNPYNGKCMCKNGWGGNKCDIKTCNYRGQVDANNNCVCDNMYTGDNCDKCFNYTVVTSSNGQSKNLYNLCNRGNNGNGNWNLVASYTYIQNNNNYCDLGTNGLDCSCKPYNFDYGHINNGNNGNGNQYDYSYTVDYTVADANYNYTNGNNGNNGNGNNARSVEFSIVSRDSRDMVSNENVSDVVYYQRRIDVLKQDLDNALTSDANSIISLNFLMACIIFCYHFMN